MEPGPTARLPLGRWRARCRPARRLATPRVGVQPEVRGEGRLRLREAEAVDIGDLDLLDGLDARLTVTSTTVSGSTLRPSGGPGRR